MKPPWYPGAIDAVARQRAHDEYFRKDKSSATKEETDEPENNLMAIGSGGPYAQAAALALLKNTDLEAREIVEKALNIAGDICVFTNHNITIEEL